MTVLSRGARVRRGGRRPGWLLLTALLVLAIGASSALVFTDRVELLKLAVILALWAAIVTAFVSVIYRRQSDLDQARARDLKLVYDLQLDREISARREYELTVESQLRRELASELHAQAADEVAALRAELAALRTSLEVLFDAELDQRPALESERAAVRGFGDWDRDDEQLGERVNRVASVRAEDPTGRADDTSIIDVPEEPLVAPRPNDYAFGAREPFRDADGYEAAQAYPGAQWPQDNRHVTEAPPPSRARWAPPEQHEPAYRQRSRRRYEAPQPDTQFGSRSPDEQQRSAWAPPDEPPRRHASAADGQPVDAADPWLPPGAPEGNRDSVPVDEDAVTADDATAVNEPRLAAPPRAELRGRHSAPPEAVSRGPAEPVDAGDGWQDGSAAHRTGSRHSAESGAEPARPEPAMAPPPEPAARHRGFDPSSDSDAPRSGGQSVADLLARLQASPAGGGRRRRREE